MLLNNYHNQLFSINIAKVDSAACYPVSDFMFDAHRESGTKRKIHIVFNNNHVHVSDEECQI